MKVVIIGAGLSGLASAALLAKQGYQVTILEKNNQIGGRASIMKKRGFTFDLGPSWYLMPDVFERFFKHFNLNVNEILKLKKLKHNYNVFFADGSKITIEPDKEKVTQVFEEIEPGAGKKFLKYIQLSEKRYQVATQEFLYKNYDSIFDLINPKFLKHLPTLNIFQTMDQHIKKYFKNEKLHQILQYTLVFLGGSPKNMLSPFSLFSHVDFNQGVYYPKVGIHGIPQAIAELAKEYGAQIKLNEPVIKLSTNKKKLTTITTSKQTYSPDIVISATDYHHTEKLIDKPENRQYSKSYWKSKTFEPSLFLMYLGYKGKLPQLKHHNLLFSNDWMRHFDDIYKHPNWPQNPSLYICNPNKSDPQLAPKNHENLFVLVPVSLKLKDTPKHRKRFGDLVLKQIHQLTGIDLSPNLVIRETFSINDFKSHYNSYNGYAMGMAHTSIQTAAFRPRNKSTKLNNLYFAGATTIPGIGMPMCLISGELAANRIQHDFPNTI